MRNPLESLDRFQALQRRQSRFVIFAVLLAPMAAAGLLGIAAALGHIIVAIAEGRLVHGSIEAFLFGTIGAVLLAVELVLIRKALGIRRQLKEVLAHG